MKAASLPFPAEATRDAARACGTGVRRAEAWPVSIIGLPFAPRTVSAAAAEIDAMIASRRPHRVLTATSDLLLQLREDPDLHRVAATADLVLCASTALLWASWCLGNALPERVTAAGLADRVLRSAAARGHRVCLLHRASAGAGLAGQLQAAYPGLLVTGEHAAPGFAPLDAAAVLSVVRAARPDLLLSCALSAADRKALAGWQAQLAVPVCFECGVPAEALGAAATAAPARTRWGPRLLAWRDRIERAVRLLPDVARQWVAMAHARRGRQAGGSLVSATPDWVHLDAGVDVTRAACNANPAFWRLPTSPAAHYTVDVSRVQRIDATGLAVLAHAARALQRNARQLILLRPSAAMEAALQSARLAALFPVAADPEEARQLAPSPTPSAIRGATRSLAWCGEVLAANVEDVWQMTSDYIRTFAVGGATLVVIDLARLRFIDAAGATLMLRVKRWAQELRTEVLFAHPQPHVLTVLEHVRLAQLLLEGGQ